MRSLISADREMNPFVSLWNSMMDVPSMMKADLKENDKEILLDIDMPGAKKEDIKINLKGNVLTVSTEYTKENKSEEGQRVIWSERSSSYSERSFTLPENVKQDDVKAKYDNGVLHLTIVKPEQIKPAGIEIE